MDRKRKLTFILAQQDGQAGTTFGQAGRQGGREADGWFLFISRDHGVYIDGFCTTRYLMKFMSVYWIVGCIVTTCFLVQDAKFNFGDLYIPTL